MRLRQHASIRASLASNNIAVQRQTKLPAAAAETKLHLQQQQLI
jgi:hypothetical protein